MAQTVVIDAIVLAMPRRLVSTGQAATALSVHRATLNRWKNAGLIKPADTTLGGHDRWDLEDLRRQIRESRLSEDDEE